MLPMDSLHPLEEEATALLSRKTALERIVQTLNNHDCLVSALGYISRDLYALTGSMRARCFYCMGSMGSVTPLALGISLACPDVKVFALEGDGSLLMNLGTLATLRRYGCDRVRLVVFDNGCYESTGRQLSQPEDFYLEDICRAAGLPTQVATHLDQVGSFIQSPSDSDRPQILVIKVACASPYPRMNEEPTVIAKRFSEWLEQL